MMSFLRLTTGLLTILTLSFEVGCTTTQEDEQTLIVPRPADPGPACRIDLRTAMIPGSQPQPVYIRLHERRGTAEQDLPLITHDLRVEIFATLARTETSSAGETFAKLNFDHIILAMEVVGRPETTQSYDSAKDKPDTGNPLADLMEHVKNAEVLLRIGPSGRLRELDGLDSRWPQSLLMAPPALLTAQWLFRDAGMEELIAESLFPPMPAMPVAVGDAWETRSSASISLVADLDARVRNQLARVTPEPGHPPHVAITGKGMIVPAQSVLQGVEPGIRPTVKASTFEIQQTLRPGSQDLQQEITRNLELQLKLTPPTGNERRHMTLRQEKTITSRRGAAPPISPEP